MSLGICLRYNFYVLEISSHCAALLNRGESPRRLCNTKINTRAINDVPKPCMKLVRKQNGGIFFFLIHKLEREHA